jgi:hypothetical protein
MTVDTVEERGYVGVPRETHSDGVVTDTGALRAEEPWVTASTSYQ